VTPTADTWDLHRIVGFDGGREADEDGVAWIMNPSVKWAAKLAHVREVSLVGTADLRFWRDRLLKDDLSPVETEDGKARLLIVAAEAKFMGVRFREVSFSVLVSRPDAGGGPGAAYLARAFNSSWPFAFCERVFFAAPYHHAEVRVSASLPASIRLARKGEGVFQAEMRAGALGALREPARRGEEGWEGPVFLPQSRPGKGHSGYWFFARVRGQTQAYPFLPAEDSLTIEPSPGSEFLRALLDSRFVAQEWAVREDAMHAKSKTYMRERGPAVVPQTGPTVAPDHSRFSCGGFMVWSGSFEALKSYLRRFTNIGGDPAYDTNGILILLRELANNLRENAPAEEVRELAETLTPEEAEFLGNLATLAQAHHRKGR
jgi:hypothetical protein